MSKRLYYKILEKAEACDETIADDHLQGFVNSFVLSHSRERWGELLLRKPKKLLSIAHKVEAVLDHRYCRPISVWPDFASTQLAVYFDFSDSPYSLSPSEIARVEVYRDAILSLSAGSIAFLLSHEGRLWECRR